MWFLIFLPKSRFRTIVFHFSRTSKTCFLIKILRKKNSHLRILWLHQNPNLPPLTRVRIKKMFLPKSRLNVLVFFSFFSTWESCITNLIVIDFWLYSVKVYFLYHEHAFFEENKSVFNLCIYPNWDLKRNFFTVFVLKGLFFLIWLR